MNPEKKNKELEINPENFQGRDYRVPLINFDGKEYILHGLSLPNDWKHEIPRLKLLKLDGFIRRLTEKDENGPFNCEFHQDEHLGLLTNLVIKRGKEISTINLDATSAGKGEYVANNVTNIYSAVKHLEIFSRYLTYVSDTKIIYPYIEAKGFNNCYSNFLEVPESLRDSKNNIFPEFENEAREIADQFGTKLRYIYYNEQGIPDLVNIDTDDCHYCLTSTYSYGAHNVDDLYQAAALHAIVGTSINKLLELKNY